MSSVDDGHDCALFPTACGARSSSWITMDTIHTCGRSYARLRSTATACKPISPALTVRLKDLPTALLVGFGLPLSALYVSYLGST